MPRTCSAFNQPREEGFTRPVKVCKESWWLNPDTFYQQAHQRFHESGCAVVNRSKEFTGNVIGPTSFKQRASVMKRAKQQQTGWRA